MRLITFSSAPGQASRVGIVSDDEAVCDLSGFAGKAPFDTSSMLALIEAGPPALAWLRSLNLHAAEKLRMETLHLLAPIPRPRKNVFCVGWNYLEHFKEGEKTRAAAIELPERPTFFTKAPTTVNGPFEPIPLDASITEKIDWEVELALVIGMRGRNISESEAMAHVWGYTVLNDVTGRDIQRQHGQQWFKGKSLDGSCPMGPWLVTADAVDPTRLRLSCSVNGVVKQDSSTEHMYFAIPRLIAELSHGLTLEPGDMIATGTPSGVGHARTPPEFLHAGDVLESRIESIGTIRNVIGTGATARGRA